MKSFDRTRFSFDFVRWYIRRGGVSGVVIS